MWNVRMRASRLVNDLDEKSDGIKEVHISGAEGIFEENEISRAINQYLKRSLSHSRGAPDKIFFTIENVKQNPIKIPFLTITTIQCSTPQEAMELATERLLRLDIEANTIEHALSTISSNTTMRGAALIKMKSGVRADHDIERGVRVSRLGIDKEAEGRLDRKLIKLNINTTRVKEALILASKVAHHKDIIAELCVSDDPDYTTGYMASKEFGYLRIPNIKNYGDMSGGRVFFIKEDTDIPELINYLEKTPAIIGD